MNTLESRLLPNAGSGPSPKMGASLEYYKGGLYVFGYSFYSVALGLEMGSELYRYDLDQEVWEIVNVTGSIPDMRQNHFSCIYNDEMYILYGFITEYTYEHNTIYKFNFESKEWIFVGFGNSKGLLAASQVQDGQYLYLMFGRDTTEVFNTLTKLIYPKILQNLKSWLRTGLHQVKDSTIAHL